MKTIIQSVAFLYRLILWFISLFAWIPIITFLYFALKDEGYYPNNYWYYFKDAIVFGYVNFVIRK